MSELDNAFKKAFIKFVNVSCPELIKAMNDLERAIRLMPRSQRIRY